MTLPKEAGKLPWSEGSLLLMQNLQHEMQIWETEVNEGNSVCSKLDCHFCRLTKPVPRPIIPEFVMSKIDFTVASGEKWTTEETGLLIKNLNRSIKEIVPLFPKRDYWGIANKKHKIKAGHF